jgi:3-oxoacyl-[acyl-carrier protein] reductase
VSERVLVTGGSMGIGRAIAQRLAADGAQVVIWDVNFEGFDGGAFKPAAQLKVDVADLASVERGFADSVKTLGHIDIMINNAGINGPVENSWDYPVEAWHKVIAVDLTGVFYCCRVAAPHMRDRKYGRIVNIASIAGKEGMARIAPYSAAKAGVIGFTKALAKELTDSNVMVNAVAPVITETDLFKEMTQEHINGAKARIPMGRFLTIPEIAALVSWISSRDCSFTTGFCFDISGGRATY